VSRPARSGVLSARWPVLLLVALPAMASLGALSACAGILGFDDLRTPEADAAVPSSDAGLYIVPVDAGNVKDAAMPPMDASTEDAHPQVVADAGDGGCVAQLITLDAINANGTVSASHIDTYAFSVPSSEELVVRVRTGSLSADVEVLPSCDPSASSVLAMTAAPDGLYSRGVFAKGTYYLRVAWDASVTVSSPYTFDVMKETPATNTCGMPTSLTTGTPVSGNTFTGADLSAGCPPPPPVYGQLFYGVDVPANSAWEVTGTPGAWTMVLEALASCTNTTCALPTALSPSAGAPASLELNNTSTSTATFLIGASASQGDGASGGGSFTLTATALNRCVTEGASCPAAGGATGLCCGGICEPLGVGNSCGKTCGTSCPLTSEVCTSGACACPSSLSSMCPPACVDTTSDPNNCGKCNLHCTTSDPHATGVTCNKGACQPVCNGSYPTDCGGVCANLKNDNNNCGSCGAKCTGGRTCSGKSCNCNNPAEPDDCGGANCTNLQTDNNNCGQCGVVCAKVDPNATGTCNGSGACTLVCNTGYKTCAANKPCVHVLGNDNNNCGDCGVKCATTDPTMTAACTAGTCVMTCKPADTCPGNVCTNMQTDVNNCGGCGHVCPTPEAGTAACVMGVCH
jgi:hypothetical protein